MTLPQKLYVNVYTPFAAQVGTAYANKETADQMAARGRLACIEIDMSRMDSIRCRVLDGGLPPFAGLTA